MRYFRRIVPFVLLTLTALAFAGCGGGGGGGAAPAATQTDTYRFFAGSLHAVDPANPANPLVVDSEAHADEATIVHGTIDAAAKTVTDLHARTVVYVKGGKLYKVSALKGATPAPVQLSSAADVQSIETVAPDLANHNNAQVVFRAVAVAPTPTPTPVPVEPVAIKQASLAAGDASGTSYKMVRVGMSATDTPIPAKEPLSALNDQTGAIIGWLAFEDNANVIKRYDANFQNGKDVIPYKNSVAFVDSTLEGIFMEVDGDLYGYHVATGELRRLTSTATGIYGNTVKDGDHLYVTDGGYNILKVPLGNPTSAETFVPTDGAWAMPFGFTDTKVVYYQGGKMLAKPKVGGEPVILSPAGWGFVGAKGTVVYFNSSKEGIPTAVAVRDDGTVLSETANAYWVGASVSNTYAPAVSSTPQYMVMATGYKTDGTGFGGGALQSFDAATNRLVATLGTIPADVRWIEVYGQIGVDVLGYAWDNNDDDVFFMNLKTPNSLVRMSNTPEVDEWPLPVLDYDWWRWS